MKGQNFFIIVLCLSFLVSCQHRGDVGGSLGIDCVVGFVKVKNTCQSLNSLSTSELNLADSQLEEQNHLSEENLSVRAETKKMLAKMKEVRRGHERLQGSQGERYQSPALSLGPPSRRPIGAPTSYLRTENTEAFRNEFRNTYFQGSF